MPASTLPAFEESARRSVEGFQQATRVRQQELSTPVFKLAPAAQIQRSRDSDARFHAARLRALARVEPFLDESAVHLEFRRQFDTWAATIAAQSHGVRVGPFR